MKKKTSVPKKRVFLYKFEYCPNPDCIVIHARVRFPKEGDMDSLDLRFGSKKKGKKRHALYAALAKIKGIQSASGGRYSLQVTRANSLFTWDELIPKVVKAIQINFAGERQMDLMPE